ncbi:hypothetical protein Q3O60_08530 [Alkalimonas collagenimarina]|uniref:Uncharacterized protein n=1 Tax=Alkalimonas collagenimarina TaxID=400390 RepID=A0ABT9GYV6_9GAMM|nr:hypothetical protein [Alkalimonas collagenimarina]MDP4536231.1 hypothetical protein [Alkalimonas collagenimarina]
MKIALTTVAAITLSTLFAINADKVESSNSEVDNLIACAWFPICRDPDFQQEVADPAEAEIGEAIIACAWFPICRDPDLPFADEVTTAELV